MNHAPKTADPDHRRRWTMAALPVATLLALGLAACEPAAPPSGSTPPAEDMAAPETSTPADTAPADDMSAPETETENAYPSPMPEPLDEREQPPSPIAPEPAVEPTPEPAPGDTPQP